MHKPTYDQLLELYEEALDTICDLEMQIRELNQDVDDYSQGFETLLDELAIM